MGICERQREAVGENEGQWEALDRYESQLEAIGKDKTIKDRKAPLTLE